MPESSDDLGYWWPKLGPCLMCGVPGVDQRHRIIDAIAERVATGDDERDVADDYDSPSRGRPGGGRRTRGGAVTARRLLVTGSRAA